MNLPPFVYAKAFWEALSYTLAGVAGLLVLFGVIPAEWAISSTAILAWFLAILKLFNVAPELRVRAALLKKSK